MAKKLAKGKKSAVKKSAKKQPAKVARKQPKPQQRPARTEIVVRVEQTPLIPTITDLVEPMKDGKKMTLQATWMSENQLLKMMQRTPREQVYRRPGKGKEVFDYVTGSYCTKWLNFVFGWNWDFEVTQHGKEGNQVWALGRLTVRGNKPGQVIVKTGFGRSDVKQKRDSGGNLDYGNDLKAASTDAMKKAASLLGFASDIYGKADYKAESGHDPLPPADPRPSQGKVYEEPSVQVGTPQVPFEDHVCQTLARGGCGADLTKAEAEFSKRMYGRELCRSHYPKK